MAGIECVPYNVKCPKCKRKGEVVIAEDENPVYGRDPEIESISKGFERAPQFDKDRHLAVACTKCGVEAKY